MHKPGFRRVAWLTCTPIQCAGSLFLRECYLYIERVGRGERFSRTPTDGLTESLPVVTKGD